MASSKNPILSALIAALYSKKRKKRSWNKHEKVHLDLLGRDHPDLLDRDHLGPLDPDHLVRKRVALQKAALVEPRKMVHPDQRKVDRLVHQREDRLDRRKVGRLVHQREDRQDQRKVDRLVHQREGRLDRRKAGRLAHQREDRLDRRKADRLGLPEEAPQREVHPGQREVDHPVRSAALLSDEAFTCRIYPMILGTLDSQGRYDHRKLPPYRSSSLSLI